MAEVNNARDYLVEVTARPSQRQRGAYSAWVGVPRTFFGELELGAPGVFVPCATPTRTTAAGAGAGAGAGARPPRGPPRYRQSGDPFYTPPRRGPRPAPRRRTTRSGPAAPETPPAPPPPTPRADATGNSSGYTRRERTPPLGASARNPFEVSDEEMEDSDSEDSPPPPYTPTPAGQGGGAGAGATHGRGGGRPPSTRPPPPPSFSSPAGAAGTGAGAGAGAGSPPSSGRTSRSTGPTRMRASPIAEPVLGDEIVVGTWAHSPAGGAGPNAVVAVFDRRGRLNYRVVARTTAGVPVPAPTGTSTSLPRINLRWPYAGLDPIRLRALIDQHLRLPRDQRP